MRPPRLPAMLLALSCAAWPAQEATRCIVTGAVVDSATDEPIRRALVAVGASLVFTGADGRFRVENVPAGQTEIAAQKPGYFDCATPACGTHGSRARASVNVQPGTADVLLKLTPESKIEGRIVDEDGEPISGIQVQVLGQHVSDGQKQLNSDGGATTDDNGEYRIENLTSGAYIVKTLPRPAFWSNAFTDSASAAQVYPSRFYPNTTDATSAQTVDPRPGQAARADFTLAPVQAFRISGALRPSVPGTFINVEDGDGVALNPLVHFDPKSGTFSLAFVPAGVWTLDFAYNDPEGHGLSATETVAVGSNDVKGLRVLLQPYASVPVNLINGSAQVQLMSTDRRWRGGVFGDTGPPEAPHAIENLRPGAYRVLVSSSGSGCLDSLTSGNVDLTREDLIVAPGSQPQAINVVMRSDCASLQVALRSAGQNTRATVLLIPASRALQAVTGDLESTGVLAFNTLSPGDYQAYAFSSIEGLEYANPDAMRDFSGQQITLSPNQHANIPLDVINR